MGEFEKMVRRTEILRILADGGVSQSELDRLAKRWCLCRVYDLAEAVESNQLDVLVEDDYLAHRDVRGRRVVHRKSHFKAGRLLRARRLAKPRLRLVK